MYHDLHAKSSLCTILVSLFSYTKLHYLRPILFIDLRLNWHRGTYVVLCDLQNAIIYSVYIRQRHMQSLEPYLSNLGEPRAPLYVLLALKSLTWEAMEWSTSQFLSCLINPCFLPWFIACTSRCRLVQLIQKFYRYRHYFILNLICICPYE